MFYRAAIFFIVLFWLTMTALLVHQEVRPGDSALREIPVAHVVKLYFMKRQEQPPSLNIYNDTQPIGQLRLLPEIDEHTQDHNLRFHGEAQVSTPLGNKRERIFWEGELEMNKLLALHRFRLAVRVHTPEELTSQIIVTPAQNNAHYDLFSPNGRTLESHDYTLDENGVRQVLDELGLDRSLLPLASGPLAMKGPTVKARLSSMTVHGEKMDTYSITVEGNGQTLLECQVNQLGEIVHVHTLLGISLAPDDLLP